MPNTTIEMKNLSRDQSLLVQPYEGLKIKRLAKKEHWEILAITLEEGVVFPTHVSTGDTSLILLEGAIRFHMRGEVIPLRIQDHLSFPGNVEHHVEAERNSKFLIIR